MLALLFVEVGAGAESGQISGKVGYGGAGDTVWAITSDCLKSYQTVTKAGGRYFFAELPAGTYKLLATGPGIWREPTEGVVLRSSVTVEVNLSMRSQGSELPAPVLSPLHGVVVNAENRPVEGAVVTEPYGQETASRNDGRFGFCSIFSAAEFKLIVKHADYETAIVPLAAGAGKYRDGKLKIVLQKRKAQ